MKKYILLVLVISILLCASCTPNADTEDTTYAPDTTLAPNTTSAPETTKAPEIVPEPIENIIFENGKTEYVIVYADSALSRRANDLSNTIYIKYRIRIPAVHLSKLEATQTKLIALGDVDGISHSMDLKTPRDFQIKVEKDKISLVAAHELAYDHLIEYTLREIFSRTENKNLTITDADSILYSDSEEFATTYVDYWKEKNGDVTKAFSAEICEEYFYEGQYGIKMAYRLYLPSNYDESKDYPLFIYLHGAGHRGNDNVATVSNIVYNFFNFKNVPMDETIVLIPQCPQGKQWVDWPWGNGNYKLASTPESKAMKTLVSLIKDVRKEYSTDESRCYVYGMSMGGFGTWDIVARYPELFTAAYPVCGGGPLDAVNTLKNIPIWTTHSDDDPTVPFSGTAGMVSAIKAAGGDSIHFKKITGYGHAIGTYTASDAEAFEWLFSQKK